MGGGKVFISYRRGRDSDSAGRLHDRLERIFGRERLFYDIDSIPPGVDFHHYLDQQVAQCAACLVVIGEGWLDQIDRLHDEDDFVRIEIAAAPRREGVRVIPVLMQGATMPRRDMLPESVQPLSRRNAVEVPYAHFAAVVDGRIVFAIRQAFTEAGSPTPDHPKPRPALLLGIEMARLKGHRDWVTSVAFSPDGTRLATGSRDTTARLWNLATGKQTSRLERKMTGYHSRDHPQIAILFDEAAGRRAVEFEGQRWVTSVAFSSDGTHLATGSRDATAQFWNLATGKQTARLDGHGGSVLSVAFSPDGGRLASGSADTTARLWNLATDREIARFEGHADSVRVATVSPDGTLLATASLDGTVRLWDLSTARESTRLEGHKAQVTSVAFSPDGTRLATGSEDRFARLWDLATGQEVARLEGHGGFVTNVAFSPDGTRIATASADKTARIWSVGER